MHLLRIGETILVRGRGQAFSFLLVTQHQLSGTLASVSAGSFFLSRAPGCYGERQKVSSGQPLGDEEMSDRELKRTVSVRGKPQEISLVGNPRAFGLL